MPPPEPSTVQLAALRRLTPEVLAVIAEHARLAHPDEACGFVTEGAVHVCRNDQDALHAEDPEAFPRTAREAFHLPPNDLLALARSLDTDDPARVLYHSHPTGGAEMSRADIAGATIGGLPSYPDLVHLVVSTPDGVVDGMRAFGWIDRAFREIACFEG